MRESPPKPLVTLTIPKHMETLCVHHLRKYTVKLKHQGHEDNPPEWSTQGSHYLFNECLCYLLIRDLT